MPAPLRHPRRVHAPSACRQPAGRGARCRRARHAGDAGDRRRVQPVRDRLRAAARGARHRARLRIFTPGRELPFAGHPTVGTAVLLALRDRGGEPDAVAFGLEETVGVVPCVVEVEGEGRGHARFRAPRLPEIWGEARGSGGDRLGARARSARDRLRPAPTEPAFRRRRLRLRPGARAATRSRARVRTPTRSEGLRRRASVGLRLHAADDPCRPSFPRPHVRPELRHPRGPGDGLGRRRFRRRADAVRAARRRRARLRHRAGLRDGPPERHRPPARHRRAGALASVEIGGGAVLVSEGTLRL